MIRYIFTSLLISLTLSSLAQTPTTLTLADKKEIRYAALDQIKNLKSLLNVIASTDVSDYARNAAIQDSYLPSSSQIFYGDAVIIEDDIKPQNTVSHKGNDLTVSTYLNNLALFYKKGNVETINFSELYPTDVRVSTYPFVQVRFKSYFSGEYIKDKKAKYAAVYRVAEFRAEKENKNWIVYITRISFSDPKTDMMASSVTAIIDSTKANRTTETPKNEVANSTAKDNGAKTATTNPSTTKADNPKKTDSPTSILPNKQEPTKTAANQPVDSPKATSTPPANYSKATQPMRVTYIPHPIGIKIAVAVVGLGAGLYSMSVYNNFKSKVDQLNSLNNSLPQINGQLTTQADLTTWQTAYKEAQDAKKESLVYGLIGVAGVAAGYEIYLLVTKQRIMSNKVAVTFSPYSTGVAVVYKF